MIIIDFIKEWHESRIAKKKIKAIYGGAPPIHKGCEDVKNGIPVLDRYKEPVKVITNLQIKKEEYYWPQRVRTEK